MTPAGDEGISRKRRVLTVIRHPVGGIRTYLKYTYSFLNATKYQFTVFAVRDLECEALQEDLGNQDVTIIQTAKFGFKFAVEVIWQVFSLRPDVIHSQGSSCGATMSLLNCLTRIPHVITFHETFDENLFRGRWKGLRRWIVSLLFSRADCLNVVGKEAKENLLTYFPRLRSHESRIAVIPNGIDVGLFSAKDDGGKRLQDFEGIDWDSFVIGYLGRYMPEKGFPVLIQALEILKNSDRLPSNMRVLGFGWGAFIREYQAEIKRKRLADYVVFAPFQPNVRWVFRQLNLLVIPSLREAFPLVAVEGLVCGTPIVASDCIGLREVLNGSPARVCKPGDAQELAAALVECYQNPHKDEAVAYVEEARRRFDSRVTAAKLDQLFDQVVRSHGRAIAYEIAE